MLEDPMLVEALSFYAHFHAARGDMLRRLDEVAH